MKINLSTVLMDHYGKPMMANAPKYKRDRTGAIVYDESTSDPIILEPAKEATLGGVAFLALQGNCKGDDAMSGDDKMRMFKIAQLLTMDGEVDISLEDCALLKKRIAELFDFTTFGRCAEAMDPPAAD